MAPFFVRRAAATGIVAALAGHAAHDGLLRHPHGTLPYLVAGAIGLVAVGIGRRALAPLVLARGALWMAAGAAFADTLHAFRHHLSLTPALIAVGASAALWLTQPLLDTPEAHAAFAPRRFRSLFLAGATALGGIAFVATLHAMSGFVRHDTLNVAESGGLAALLAIAVTGTLRMRTWGVLLGGFASVACLAVAPFFGPLSTVTLTLAALPALVFWVLPLLVARVRRTEEAPVRYRVASAPASSTAKLADAPLDEDDLRAHGVSAITCAR
jgi:hypothetical protein